MTRRRRAAALLGLALLLGVLAASDVAGREAALRRQLGPAVPVVVVRAPLRAGERIARAALAVREVPERYAPPGRAARSRAPRSDSAPRWRSPSAPTSPPSLLAVPGADADRAVPSCAAESGRSTSSRSAPRTRSSPGARVDVLVTYDGRAGAPGPTRLALADVEVLAARAPPSRRRARLRRRAAAPAGHAAGDRAPGGGAHGRGGRGPAGAPAASSGALKRRFAGHRSPV